MSIDRAQVLRILRGADHPLGVKELLKQGGFHPGQQTDLKRVLRELVRGGQLAKEGKRYQLPGGAPKAPAQARSERPAKGAGPSRGHKGAAKGGRAARDVDARVNQLRRRPDVVEGILHVHRDGFGFVHPVAGEGENIFLPPDQAQRALDGDRVLVQVVEGRGGRTAGELLEVVSRVRERAVGEYREEGGRAYVVATDKSLKGIVSVPRTQLARPGDLVKVVLGIGRAVLEPGEALVGEVTGSLGKPGDPSAEILSVAYAQGFHDEFPPEVMEQADRFALAVSDEEAHEEDRRDLRTLPLVTIDGEDARDFDDAVYCEPARDGWRLVVAIADVTHYVRLGTALDQEAFRRGTSVYLPDRVLPMLPERLSNGICSLRPDEDRLCMVADMRLDSGGNLDSYELYPGVMRSFARCTYEEVQAVLDGKDVPHRNAFRPHFENLWRLAQTLNGMRRKRGAIDFDLPEFKVILGDDGLPVRMEKRERLDAHRLIEECMLAANEAVARYFRERELPSVYRFHGEPDEDKLEVFAALARAYGFELGRPGEISSHDLNRFLTQLEGHSEQRALNQLLLRSMMQAVYSAENVGHYGLGAEHYLHFTSPIRRYPDLLVHRLLKEHWARGARVPPRAERDAQEARLEEMAVQCSERERAAVSVEREVVSFFSTLLMKDRVGEEFRATVAGISDFGFFVELDDEHVEGLVKLEALGFGGRLDETLHALTWANGRRVKVGDKLSVRLISANVERRQLEFDPLQFEGEQPLPTRRERSAEGGGAGPRGFAGMRERPGQGGRGPRGGTRGGEREGSGQKERRQPEGRSRFGAPQRQRFGAKEGGRRAEDRERVRPPPQPWEPPKGEGEEAERSSSPHPGFDRLRALAARGGAPERGGGRGERPARGERTGTGRSAGRGKPGARGEKGAPKGRTSQEPERDKFGNPRRKPHGGGGGKGKGKPRR